MATEAKIIPMVIVYIDFLNKMRTIWPWAGSKWMINLLWSMTEAEWFKDSGQLTPGPGYSAPFSLEFYKDCSDSNLLLTICV